LAGRSCCRTARWVSSRPEKTPKQNKNNLSQNKSKQIKTKQGEIKSNQNKDNLRFIKFEGYVFANVSQVDLKKRQNKTKTIEGFRAGVVNSWNALQVTLGVST
jgi:hypothetical protein